MTDKERYAIVQSVLAGELAERVVQKLLERQKRALVVYTGSNMSVAPGLDQLRALREDGFTYRVLLSRSAAAMLDVPAIRAALEPEALWVERAEETPEALTVRYDTILVPTLTVNTAAHVAACMADTPAAAIILDGLMRGKNVIAAVDGCCPDNPERIRRGFRMTEALKGKLRENKDTLRAYGAYLTTADQLRPAALRAIRAFVPGGAAPKAPQTAASQSKASPSASGAGSRPVVRPALEGRGFRARQLQNCPSHCIVAVPKGTIVTQLTADNARRRDITIQIET